MDSRIPILPVLVATASLALWPVEARGERLGLLELRFDTVVGPSLSRGGEQGSFQLIKLATAIEPGPSVFLGAGVGVGYASTTPWPVLRPLGSGLAVSGDLFARYLSKYGPGLQPGVGLSVDGIVAGGSIAQSFFLGTWLDFIGGIWSSDEQTVAFMLSPGFGFTSFAGRSGVRPLLKLSAGWQF